jgi:SHS2 domain-containing protein
MPRYNTSMPYEEIDHTADRAFRVRGDSREQLFAEAAGALYAAGDIRTGKLEESKILHLRADDLEGLLILWLNELLFLLDQERHALREIRIERLTDTELQASGRMAAVRAVGKDIKAATYSGLRIVEKDGVWSTEIVLDV